MIKRYALPAVTVLALGAAPAFAASTAGTSTRQAPAAMPQASTSIGARTAKPPNVKRSHKKPKDWNAPARRPGSTWRVGLPRSFGPARPIFGAISAKLACARGAPAPPGASP